MDNSVPQAFIFMKVGIHGGESLKKIVKRKQREVNDVGMAFWGYGGTVLHPTNQVQPFVEKWKEESVCIEVLMEEINGDSKSGYPLGTVKQFAVSDKKLVNDKELWKRIPKGIETSGEHALVLDEISPCHMELDLRQFEVDRPRKKAINATQYLAFRGMKKLTERKRGADKGCLVAVESTYGSPGGPEAIVSISYRARLLCPYAVFLWPLKK